MTGQKFEDRKGRTVTVLEVDGSIATLINGEKVAVARLNDQRFYKPKNNGNGNGNGNVNESVSQVSSSSSPKTEILESFDSNDRYQKMLQGSSLSIGEEGSVYGNGQAVVGRDGRPVTPYSQVKMGGSVVESHNDNLRNLGVEVKEEVTPVTQRYQQPSQPQSEEARKQELLEKYGVQEQPKPNNNDNGLEKYVEPSVEVNGTKMKEQSRSIHQPKEDNPVHKMFDKAKKVHPIKVNLKINEKIPEKSIIKMMEENFDESAIEYYTKDIYNKLMSDPSIIEDQVRDAIKKYVNSRSKTQK